MMQLHLVAVSLCRGHHDESFEPFRVLLAPDLSRRERNLHYLDHRSLRVRGCWNPRRCLCACPRRAFLGPGVRHSVLRDAHRRARNLRGGELRSRRGRHRLPRQRSGQRRRPVPAQRGRGHHSVRRLPGRRLRREQLRDRRVARLYHQCGSQRPIRHRTEGEQRALHERFPHRGRRPERDRNRRRAQNRQLEQLPMGRQNCCASRRRPARAEDCRGSAVFQLELH